MQVRTRDAAVIMQLLTASYSPSHMHLINVLSIRYREGNGDLRWQPIAILLGQGLMLRRHFMPGT